MPTLANSPALTMDATIRARVRLEQKRALDAIATARQLKLPDIVREALRFYLANLPQSAADKPGGFFFDGAHRGKSE